MDHKLFGVNFIRNFKKSLKVYLLLDLKLSGSVPFIVKNILNVAILKMIKIKILDKKKQKNR